MPTDLVGLYRKHRNIVGLMLQKGPLTRSQLVELTGTTQPTITRWVTELVQAGLVHEIASVTDRPGPGRPTKVIDLAEDALYVGALHLRRSSAEIGVVNGKGRVSASVSFAFPDGQPPEKNIAQAVSELQALLLGLHISEQRLLGIGVAASGLVDTSRGVEAQVNFVGGSLVGVDVPIIQQLEEHFTVPIFMETNAWAMAVGEHWFGHKEKDFILFYVDNGVGAATVLDGQLHRGRGAAGEVGHVEIPGNPVQCHCGRCGCIGTKITTPALLAGGRSLGFDDFTDLVAAKEHDARVGRMFNEGAQAIAYVCAPIVDLLDVETVILAGPLFKVANMVVDIGRYLQKQSFSARLHGIRAVPSLLDEQIGLIGAASLVFSKLLAVGGTRY